MNDDVCSVDWFRPLRQQYQCTEFQMWVFGNCSLTELEMPVETGILKGEHSGAGRRKTHGKEDGREKALGIPCKNVLPSLELR